MLLGVLAATVIIGLRVQSLYAEREQILSQRRSQAATLAQFAANYSARLYDQSSRVAREVSDYIRNAAPGDEELRRYLAARAQDTSADDYIVVLDASGRVRATSEAAGPIAMSFATRTPAGAWEADAPQVIPVLRSRISGRPIYSVSQRLEDRAGAFSGVVGVNVRPEGIRPTAARRPQDPLLTVWAPDGRFIAASFVDFDSDGRGIAPPTPANLDIPGSPRREDRHRLTAQQPVPGWPLIAVASYDMHGVLADWRRSVYEALVFLVLLSAAIGALVALGIRTADREAAARRDLEAANAATAVALEEGELLMREIHHRVKNSLMMTASLLNLQARRFQDPEVRQAFESTKRQLHSIGLVHEALYKGSSLEAVELPDYLRRLLNELANAYGAESRGVAVELDAEALLLAPHQTAPLGLIVAEVITNAFKHAFGEGGGLIQVRARLANPDEICIEIRDDGNGYAKVKPSASEGGLGSRLIDALAHQLGATVALSNEGGAAFRLTFPWLSRAPDSRQEMNSSAQLALT